MGPRFRLAWILLFIGLLVYYLSYFTNWLGPYGGPNDNYHLIILVATLFIAFTVALRFIHRGRPR